MDHSLIFPSRASPTLTCHMSTILPTHAKMLIANIAAASMFIYLGHEVIIELLIKIFGENKPWLALTLSVIAGVLGLQTYSYLERLFFQARKGWKEQT